MRTKVSSENGIELPAAGRIYIYLAALREGTDCGPGAYAIFEDGTEPRELIKEFHSSDRIELCWRGMRYIVGKRIPEGGAAVVFSNEEAFRQQFSKKVPGVTSTQRKLQDGVWEFIEQRDLNICVTFIPPTWNIAWQLVKQRLERY